MFLHRNFESKCDLPGCRSQLERRFYLNFRFSPVCTFCWADVHESTVHTAAERTEIFHWNNLSVNPCSMICFMSFHMVFPTHPPLVFLSCVFLCLLGVLSGLLGCSLRLVWPTLPFGLVPFSPAFLTLFLGLTFF